MNLRILGWVSEAILIAGFLTLSFVLYIGLFCTDVGDWCYPVWQYGTSLAYIAILVLLPISAIGFFILLRRITKGGAAN